MSKIENYFVNKGFKFPLSKGQFALIDEEDKDRLSKYKWKVNFDRHTKKYYAARNKNKNGRYTTILMHRVILDAPKDMQVDHINRNTLDNRKDNLRLVTNAQNQHNANIQKNNTSGFKGVTHQKNKYIARIGVNGKRMYLGLFDSPIEASLAYNNAKEELLEGTLI